MPEHAKFIKGGFEINKRISELFVRTAQLKAHFNGDDVTLVNDYQLMIMGKVMDEKKIGCLKSFHYHIQVPDIELLKKSEANGLTKVSYYKELFGSLEHYNHVGFNLKPTSRKRWRF
jgi:trehalose-6-phosphate synthase